MAYSTRLPSQFKGEPPERAVGHLVTGGTVFQRRKHPRVVYRDPVYASAIGQPHNGWHLLAEDLSLGGLRLLSPEPFAVGARLLLCLEPDEVAEPIRAVALVRWVSRVEYQECYRHGVELIELGQCDRRRLQALVQHASESADPSDTPGLDANSRNQA